MAKANPELIIAIEKTVQKLQNGASYQWGHMGRVIVETSRRNLLS